MDVRDELRRRAPPLLPPFNSLRLPLLTRTIGEAARQLLGGHSWYRGDPGVGAEPARSRGGGNIGAAAGEAPPDSIPSLPSSEGADRLLMGMNSGDFASSALATASADLAITSTTSAACCCSSCGSGLQVLRRRAAVVGNARATRQRHASGATKFQDSSRSRPSLSR